MKEMTGRQSQIFGLMLDGLVEHQRYPTYQELADSLGVSTNTIVEHVKAMERKGVVVRSNRARGYQIPSVRIVLEPA